MTLCSDLHSLRIEDYHRVQATIEDVNVVVGGHSHGSGLFVAPTLRQIAPVVAGDFIPEFSSSQ